MRCPSPLFFPFGRLQTVFYALCASGTDRVSPGPRKQSGTEVKATLGSEFESLLRTTRPFGKALPSLAQLSIQRFLSAATAPDIASFDPAMRRALGLSIEGGAPGRTAPASAPFCPREWLDAPTV